MRLPLPGAATTGVSSGRCGPQPSWTAQARRRCAQVEWGGGGVPRTAWKRWARAAAGAGWAAARAGFSPSVLTVKMASWQTVGILCATPFSVDGAHTRTSSDTRVTFSDTRACAELERPPELV
jgi:hypothetical protein